MTKRYMIKLCGSGWADIKAETEAEADEIYTGMSKEELLDSTSYTIETTDSYIVDEE